MSSNDQPQNQSPFELQKAQIIGDFYLRILELKKSANVHLNQMVIIVITGIAAGYAFLMDMDTDLDAKFSGSNFFFLIIGALFLIVSIFLVPIKLKEL